MGVLESIVGCVGGEELFVGAIGEESVVDRIGDSVVESKGVVALFGDPEIVGISE